MLKIILTIGTIQLTAIAVNILRSKIAAVLLGPQGVGVVSVVDQIVLLVTQASAFGLPFAAVKFLSRSHSLGPDRFRATYSSLFRVLLLATVGGMAVAVVVVLWRPSLLGGELSGYHLFLFPALLSVPLIALEGFFSSVLAAAQAPRASALITLVIAISLAASTYVGIMWGGILGLYWGNLVASFAVVALALVYLRRRFALTIADVTTRIRDELRENRDMITFPLILYVTSFTDTLSYFMARYSALHVLGEEGAGLLQAAIRIAFALNLLLGAANGLYLTPRLNRDIAKEEKLEAARDFQRKLALITGVVAMSIVLFPQWTVTLLFSPAFVSVSHVLFIFIVAQYIAQLAGVYQSLLIGLDDLKFYGVILVIGQLSFGIFAWLLVAKYGILGIGIGFLLSRIMLFVLTLARLSVRFGFIVPPDLRLLIGYGLLSLFVAGSIFIHANPWHPLVLLSKGMLFIVFARGMLAFTTREDKHSLVQGLKRLRARLV